MHIHLRADERKKKKNRCTVNIANSVSIIQLYWRSPGMVSLGKGGNSFPLSTKAHTHYFITWAALDCSGGLCLYSVLHYTLVMF